MHDTPTDPVQHPERRAVLVAFTAVGAVGGVLLAAAMGLQTALALFAVPLVLLGSDPLKPAIVMGATGVGGFALGVLWVNWCRRLYREPRLSGRVVLVSLALSAATAGLGAVLPWRGDTVTIAGATMFAYALVVLGGMWLGTRSGQGQPFGTGS